MISKRYRRSYQPQENLKQFSLNNSKGIDESKPITDSNTVQYLENLKINLDGSLSLRDPINVFRTLHFKSVKNGGMDSPVYRPTKVFPIMEDMYLVLSSNKSFGVWSAKSEGFLKISVKWRTYSGVLKETKTYDSNSDDLANLIVLDNASVLQTRTSVTLGNCYAVVNNLKNLVQGSLYDASFSDVKETLPRYVQLYFENNIAIFEIKNPEVNTLTTADDGTPSIPVNTTLDNPYAITDTYNTSIVDIKGILLYVHTDKSLNTVSTDETGNPNRTIQDLTESVKGTRYRIVSKIGLDRLDEDVSSSFGHVAYLKASGMFGGAIGSDVDYNKIVWTNTNGNIAGLGGTFDSEKRLVGREVSVVPNNIGTCTITATYDNDENRSASCEVYVEYKFAKICTDKDDYTANGIGEIQIECWLETASGENYEPSGILLATYEFPPDVAQLSFNQDNTSKYVATFTTHVFNESKFLELKYTHLDGTVISKKLTLHPYNSAIGGGRALPYESSTISYSEPIVTTPTAYSPRSSESSVTLNVSKLYLTMLGTSTTLTSTIKSTADKIYAVWSELRPDGTYYPLPTRGGTKITVRERIEDIKNDSGNIEDEETSENSYRNVTYTSISDIFNMYDNIQIRPDVFPLTSVSSLKKKMRFKVITIKVLSDTDDAYDKEEGGEQYGVGMVLDIADYTPVFSSDWEFANYENGNSSLGNKLLYKNSILSFGHSSFKNTVFKSDAGSLITPYLNSIDSESIGVSKVTAVVPWRDYIYIATESSAILATPVENGFYTKIVNTFVGVPEEDGKCCKATLNGIIFKSGSKVFMGYPNLYSESDAVLNYTEISKPIESVLYDLEDLHYDECYALSTSSEYILVFAYSDSTYTLTYNYLDKTWSVFKYPVKLENAYIYRDGSIHAFHTNIFLKDVVEFTLNGRSENTYSDELLVGYKVEKFEGTHIIVPNLENKPISFKWDTGQKTDSISNTKQFVESKLVFATLDDRDTFPFTTYVAIDGDPHVVTTDVSTDAPFWKTENSKGVLGTAFRLGGEDSPASGAFNTLRQLVIRYSGKGKSIRHVIEGESLCNFKMYETYVRYKNLNVK